MTIILLIFLGVVWTALLVVIVSFFVKRYASKFPSQKIRKIFTAGLIAVGLSPLFYEYWLYYDFRNYCVGNSGMVLNNPVKTDAIVFEGNSYYLETLLWSEKVRHLVYTYPKKGSSLWPDEPRRFPEAEKDSNLGNELKPCFRKSVQIDGVSILPNEHTRKSLLNGGICFGFRPKNLTPRYKVMAYTNPELFRRSPSNEYRSHDKSLSLIDNLTGETVSEFRTVSTPVGPIMNLVWLFSTWNKYSCTDYVLPEKKRSYDYDYHLALFLDAVLLPLDE